MLKIIFFGTPSFAVPSLSKLIQDERFDIVTVITQNDKPVGRKKTLTPSPIKSLAKSHDLNILQPEKISLEVINNISKLAPDIFIIVAYGKILPAKLLDIPRYGSINIHPSLLPKYRGPSPLQSTILNGDLRTGVSIMLIDEKMDHGPILKVTPYTLTGDETYESLGNQLFHIGANELPDTIVNFTKGSLKPKEQDHNKATYTKLIKKENGLIDWTKPASYIEHMTRAYHPWPNTYFIPVIEKGIKNNLNFNINNPIKIHKAHISNNKTKLAPGTLFKTLNNELAIACGENSSLSIENLQLSGKKIITAQEFLRGNQNITLNN